MSPRSRVSCSLALLVLFAGCGGDDEGYRGDPRCFAEGSRNASCVSGGVRYWVVDRASTVRIPGGLEARLDDIRTVDQVSGAQPERGTFVVASLSVRNLSARPLALNTDGQSLSLSLGKGDYFAHDGDAERAVAGAFSRLNPLPRGVQGSGLVVFDVPRDAAERIDEFPAYLTIFQPPERCPGRSAQCFGYIRLWK